MGPIKSGSKHAEIDIRIPGGIIQSVILKGDRYVLGREGSDGLRYPDIINLSREHVAFERQGQDWIIRDLKSTNGTLLNGAPLTAPQLLHSKDVVTAGSLTSSSRRPTNWIAPPPLQSSL
jgi:pSer/pThr/pTyr-binding forkhead associated (FHA) protein